MKIADHPSWVHAIDDGLAAMYQDHALRGWYDTDDLINWMRENREDVLNEIIGSYKLEGNVVPTLAPHFIAIKQIEKFLRDHRGQFSEREDRSREKATRHSNLIVSVWRILSGSLAADGAGSTTDPSNDNISQEQEDCLDLIHDPGSGPEIRGTRITVYSILPYLLDPTATEDYIGRANQLTSEQVSAVRAYILRHPDTILARHLEIEKRIAAGNGAEVREKAEASRETFLRFKESLASREKEPTQHPNVTSDEGERAAGPTPGPLSASGLPKRSPDRRVAHDMQGLLADVNVQGQMQYIKKCIFPRLGVMPVLDALGIGFATLDQLRIPSDINDRDLWISCQAQGWVLFTEDRNNDGPNSLQQTLIDSWSEGLLPVLTLANKARFERDRDFAAKVASDLASLLFDIADGQFRDQPRVWVPV